MIFKSRTSNIYAIFLQKSIVLLFCNISDKTNMNPAFLLVSLLATSMYQSVAAQRGGRQRDASHQMPPGGMQGPPPGMPQERGKQYSISSLCRILIIIL